MRRGSRNESLWAACVAEAQVVDAVAPVQPGPGREFLVTDLRAAAVEPLQAAASCPTWG